MVIDLGFLELHDNKLYCIAFLKLLFVIVRPVGQSKPHGQELSQEMNRLGPLEGPMGRMPGELGGLSKLLGEAQVRVSPSRN